ncbi:hypothetical protein PIB30_051712 [Stylosanthes scabra]|uniref:Homeobox domain-containing protein n=1 Tax=Stylosanthes scabra TaxID=79078 RepID=A0ABU6QJQ4_9FABA|nr:hypothetical protein [Stylosanthes scabra]
MASSNRHWPSMFKSKPCNQFQHDINSPLVSTTAPCRSTPYNPNSGCDEKSPEPKPRWNPKPEQIRILEAIFNSGMVNPPRDEIRKIRIQLQEYGQVGDANVFYWFQNRKSRSKHKLRHLTNNKNNTPSPPQPPPPQFISAITNSSSSSSSEKSSPKEFITTFVPQAFTDVMMVLPNSPTASVNQNYFQHNDININNNHHHLLIPPPPPPQPLPMEPFFPVFHNGGSNNNNTSMVATTEISNNVINHHQPPHHFVYPSISHHAHQENVDPCTDLLLSEIMNHGGGGGGPSSKKYQEQEKAAAAAAIKIRHPSQQYINFCQASTPVSTMAVLPPLPPHSSISNTTATPITVPSPFQGGGGGGGGDVAAGKCTVYINEVAFEVGVGHFNVREAFGDEAVLIEYSGHAVLTDDWGVTLHPLQHGASYYLIWFLSFFL